MDALEFVSNYNEMVDKISAVLKPEAVVLLKSLDPHDLIGPDAYFSGRNHAYGLIVAVALRKMAK